jgi:hypothetical protein
MKQSEVDIQSSRRSFFLATGAAVVGAELVGDVFMLREIDGFGYCADMRGAPDFAE